VKKEMKNYRFVLQYEGSRYAGWQKLGGKEQTIQGKLEAVLEKMVNEPVAVIGSGRTDAGVHAKMQVANAHFATNLSKTEILNYMNTYLPEDIAVLEVSEVSDEFHSRYHAVEKCYCYRISTAAVPDVFERRLLYDYGPGHLDMDAMQKAAQLLCGEHDFQSFCGRKIKKKSTVRNVYAVEIRETDGEIRFYYRGNGFLFHMIRIMTGTLLEVGEGKRSPESMQELLAAKDRQKAGATVPAKGLTLMWVKYDR
jgi:tRNA pseudouridine38-40 synthase